MTECVFRLRDCHVRWEIPKVTSVQALGEEERPSSGLERKSLEEDEPFKA